MEIYNLKINGMVNPIGFEYKEIICSWKVRKTEDKQQKKARISISADQEFHEIVFQIEGEELDSTGTLADFKIKPYTTYYWKVYVEGENGEYGTSETAFFETAKMCHKWKADWIGTDKEDTFHPVFQKKFYLRDGIKKARLYCCGLGVYEGYINGKKAGNDYLAPFINDYKDNLQYQTYDITDLLFQQKENKIEFLLGKGWYIGKFGLDGCEKIFGDEMMLIAEIRVEYFDGRIEVICTDDNWKYKGSDIEDSGIYFGEKINRQLWDDRQNLWKQAVKKKQKTPLKERYSLPLTVKEDIVPVKIIHTPIGETVLDVGQNMVGYMEFFADFPKGTRIKIECGEILQHGNFCHDNYTIAESTFEYISDGRKETVRPHFTYMGFRYLRVTGWPNEIKLGDIKCRVIYSDLQRTGFCKTQNSMLNQLYENCIWSQKSNFVDMPTDCPQRGERLGWTGDAQVFAATACYNMDTRAFYRKYLRDIRSHQLRKNGAIPNFIPDLGTFSEACSIWGDAATILPYQIYQSYGCAEEIRSYYTTMKDWVEYMVSMDESQGRHYKFQPGFQFGDWLALDGITEQSLKGSTDDNYIGCCYYYHSVKITSEIAQVLGYTEDAQRYQELSGKIRKAILNEYFTPKGRLSVDTQTAYIIALKFGLYNNKNVLIQQFKERLTRDCYKIKCGFAGTPLLCSVLGENGMEDIAYRILLNKDYPGWLYCVNLGATTVWERWNSVLSDGMLSGTGMNSLNHYAYGSVVQYFYEYIAGIRPKRPGFKEAFIEPKPDIRIQGVMCSYDSAMGVYKSEWKIQENGLICIHIEIPFNCTADVLLPEYSSNGLTYSDNVNGEMISENGKLQLCSGKYDFAYFPKNDYRHVYKPESILGDLREDKEALEILEKNIPVLYEIIQSNDIENMLITLQEFDTLHFMGIDPEIADETRKKIYNLNYYGK
ncbi:hypothetical protein C808_02080 [Lachnospiraceae bacterium M18-1]|nr:hypothetical protein C808_02080 [Lachnospiraceae bacterium M18-1]